MFGNLSTLFAPNNEIDMGCKTHTVNNNRSGNVNSIPPYRDN